MKVFLIALIATAFCFAQDAKIMIVERADSQKLAKSYREYKEALKHWEEAKAEVAKQYTHEGGKPIVGWEKIQFSADFRAIVPESSQYASGRGYVCGWNTLTNGGALTANADGVLSYQNTTDTAPSVNLDLKVKEKR